MPEKKLTQWQVPNFESTPQERQGWVDERVNSGDSWWTNQPSAAMADANLRLLGVGGDLRLKSNGLKTDIRKFVETISDIREIATLGGAEQFKSYVEMMNRVYKFIYRDADFPTQSRRALQYAVALGRGYLWPRAVRTNFGTGPRRIQFRALGPREVLPLQLPADNDVQGSYAVTIFEPMGIAEAHARFPRFQNELNAISRNPARRGFPSTLETARRYDFWDRYKFGQNAGDWDNEYCEFRYTFIRDLRVNRTGETLKMGDPGSSWYYEVPSLKSLIVTTNPANHLPESHFATEEECRVYPNLRLIITNPGMSIPLYDGPAFDWHGMMPPVPYDVDDWPWLAVGYSLLHDVASIERNMRVFLDKMYRVSSAEMKPAMGYDLNAGIPREDLKVFDVLEESENGATVGVDGDPTKALRSILPDSVRVTGEHFKLYELMTALRQKSLGLNDVQALMNLKMNLSSDNVDKILENLGPIAKGIAFNIASSQAKIAYQLKFMVPQYLDTEEIMAITGPDGVAADVFDFKPKEIVPSHMPEESSLADAGKPSNLPPIERAKRFAKNLKVVSVPNALLNVTHVQEQMKYLNFLQRGFPISFSTAFKKLAPEINWPDVPGASELDKYEWEQKRIAKVKIDTMKSIAGEVPQQGGGEGKKGQGKGGGRPPSGQQAPKLETRGTKSGQPRTVLSQSK